MASSWASVAKSQPLKHAEPESSDAPPPRTVVLDANALISGVGLLSLLRVAERVVTTAEVLKEVRDKKSREALEALPFRLETLNPAEESMTAGARAARCARAGAQGGPGGPGVTATLQRLWRA